MAIYSLDVLLSQFGTSPLFHVQYCYFLTCIQISQEAGQVVWYSHLLKNFAQLLVIHTVKGFGIVNKAEIDGFLELSCFLNDPADVRNLICGSSAFSKTSLNIWKFMVHVLLKPGLENFEHYFTSMWDECNCTPKIHNIDNMKSWQGCRRNMNSYMLWCEWKWWCLIKLNILLESI